jgi:hypothetical protein
MPMIFSISTKVTLAVPVAGGEPGETRMTVDTRDDDLSTAPNNLARDLMDLVSTQARRVIAKAGAPESGTVWIRVRFAPKI